MEQTNTRTNEVKATRQDVHQQVTDTIIRQLEAGTVPWHRPWRGNNNRLLALPYNFNSGKQYRGINIVLLWCTALAQNFDCAEWGSFKQWANKNERIRKGEKGSMVVYYDTFEKEEDGEIKKIPFLKSSIVFNKCQLASYVPENKPLTYEEIDLVEKIDAVEAFIDNTDITVQHGAESAYYHRVTDTIHMPDTDRFIATETCTATEGYYATLLHETIHASGAEKRLNRTKGKRFGDKEYAFEELTAELGSSFLCAGFNISTPDKTDHAAYIAGWLKVLRDNKHFIVSAAGEASRAVEYLHGLQPV